MNRFLSAVRHADPENSPLTDIFENLRDASPDAGCYEYSSDEEPQLNILRAPSSGGSSVATPDEGRCSNDDGTSAALIESKVPIQPQPLLLLQILFEEKDNLGNEGCNLRSIGYTIDLVGPLKVR